MKIICKFSIFFKKLHCFYRNMRFEITENEQQYSLLPFVREINLLL